MAKWVLYCGQHHQLHARTKRELFLVSEIRLRIRFLKCMTLWLVTDLSEDRGACIFKDQVDLKIKAVRFFYTSERAHLKKLCYKHGEQIPQKRCCGTIKVRGDLV